MVVLKENGYCSHEYVLKTWLLTGLVQRNCAPEGIAKHYTHFPIHLSKIEQYDLSILYERFFQYQLGGCSITHTINTI